jgi:hypothetical protein
MRALRLAVAAAVLVLASPLARAGWWDDLDKGESVKLRDLVSQPEKWHKKVVTFACVYHGSDTVFQAVFTPFNPDQHLNFTAWYDGAPIWELKSFVDDEFPFLYLGRAHPQRDDLLRLAPYTRIEVTGRVVEVYRRRPFVEIQGFRVTPATVGRAVVEWMKDGDAFASSGDYIRASAYYQRVLDEVTLDETTRLRVRQRLGEALRAAGKDLDAAKADGGKIYGGTKLPTPADPVTPTPAPPATAEAPPATPALPPPSEMGTAPATPVAPLPPERAAAPGAPRALETDLPGTPIVPTGTETTPPAPRPPSASRVAPPVAPTPAPAPAAPPPAPAASAPPPCEPPPEAGKPPAAEAPAVPAAPPPTAAASAKPPPPPPPRSPRLSGVK